ncbi:restriction endonuclease [Chloroflexota bacterium]
MIPDFQTIMGPFLRYFSDKKDHTLRETVEALAENFKLTPEEKRKLLPSGNGLLFSNRVQWARLYLNKAELIETPKRGTYRITNRGLAFLIENPGHDITIVDLNDYPEFREFYYSSLETSTKSTKVEHPFVTPEVNETPEEIIENAYSTIKRELQQQLLDNVKSSSPYFFEYVVVDLLLAMGYGGSRKEAAEIIGKSGDEGIDGVIKEDKLGLDTIYVQAKRWGNSSIGRPIIQGFVGALRGKKARKGIFVTTSTFTKDAVEYASKLEDPIILIDGSRLSELMIDHNIGISTTKSYEIKIIDSDYFTEG